jgi:hypothetical protein
MGPPLIHPSKAVATAAPPPAIEESESEEEEDEIRAVSPPPAGPSQRKAVAASLAPSSRSTSVVAAPPVPSGPSAAVTEISDDESGSSETSLEDADVEPKVEDDVDMDAGEAKPDAARHDGARVAAGAVRSAGMSESDHRFHLIAARYPTAVILPDGSVPLHLLPFMGGRVPFKDYFFLSPYAVSDSF